MKRYLAFFSLILAFISLDSCAHERKTSLGSDSIGIIGYAKPHAHISYKGPIIAGTKTITHWDN
jgi:hypothetical protein